MQSPTHRSQGLAVTPRPLLLAASALALLAGCSRPEPPAAQQPPIPVSVATVQAQVLPVTFEFVGQTESSQQVEIRARVNGFLDKRVYTEGAFVKAGDLLFLMDPKPFEADLQAARAEMAQQQARLATARANLARVQPLVADNALAAKDLDEATGQAQAAAAAVEAASARITEAQLKLGYTRITAPLSGQSSFAKVQNGAYVSASNSLLTYVARLDPVRVNFSLSENEWLRMQEEVAKGKLIAAPQKQYGVELLLADGSTFPEKGRITFADAAFSQETGTFLLRAELPNPRGSLRPGQFVRVHVHGFSRPNSIAVPQRAVQQGPRGAFVWVVDGQGKANAREVGTGEWQGDQWVVSSGLRNGEKVVVDGAMRLSPGAVVAAKDAAAAAPVPAAAPAGAPAAAPPPAAAAADAQDAVYFAKNSTSLDAAGRARVAAIAASMQARPAARAELRGYADARGDAKRNAVLAKKRAQAVRDALLAAGVAADRIVLARPADTVGGAEPAQARRVDVALAEAR